MATPLVITPDMRINDVIRLHPRTVGVFHELGLDACCGGAKPVEEAARAHGVDVDVVLEALNASRG